MSPEGDREKRILKREDALFYTTVLILVILMFVTAFAGYLLLAQIISYVLMIYLVAVAQIEWKRRGRKWW